MKLIELPKGIEALLFDIDGTLANTMPAHYLAADDMMIRLGSRFPLDFFFSTAGIPTAKVFQMLFDKEGITESAQEIAEEKEEVFKTMILKEVTPNHPICQLAIDNVGKLKMACGTGATADVAKPVLEQIGMSDYFEIVISSDMVENPKPFPDTFLDGAIALGVAPEKCVVFEDAQPGIDAALAGGMHYIDVRNHIEDPRIVIEKRLKELGRTIA